MLNILTVFACRFLSGTRSVRNRKRELELRQTETELQPEPGWRVEPQVTQPQVTFLLLLLLFLPIHS